MRAERIKASLSTALEPQTLEVRDDSHLHAGHEGAKSGGGHYSVTIVTPHFLGKNHVQRHQMVYQALGDMMKKDIHALSIRALTPEEFSNQKT